MHFSRFVCACVLGLSSGFVGGAQAQPAYSPAEASLRRQAESLKPAAADLRWQQIPWELDLQESLRLAKKEHRPIFFWAAGGRERDGVPLERC